MNKADFIKHIKSELTCNEDEAKKLIDSFTKCLTSALTKEEEVLIIGFGRFSKTYVKERDGRNPKTGKTIKIDAYNQVRFKPGQILKDAVNNK